MTSAARLTDQDQHHVSEQPERNGAYSASRDTRAKSAMNQNATSTAIDGCLIGGAAERKRPQCGGELGPSFIGCNGSAWHPVAYHQVLPAALVPSRFSESERAN